MPFRKLKPNLQFSSLWLCAKGRKKNNSSMGCNYTVFFSLLRPELTSYVGLSRAKTLFGFV